MSRTRSPGIVGPDSELIELAWVSIAEAKKLELPAITTIVLDELQNRIDEGFAPELPVPFYFEVRKKFMRELLGPLPSPLLNHARSLCRDCPIGRQ